MILNHLSLLLISLCPPGSCPWCWVLPKCDFIYRNHHYIGIKGLFGSCLLKLFSVIKKNENKENKRTCLVPSFFILKNTKNTKFREHEQFSKTETKHTLNLHFQRIYVVPTLPEKRKVKVHTWWTKYSIVSRPFFEGEGLIEKQNQGRLVGGSCMHYCSPEPDNLACILNRSLRELCVF